MTNPLSLTLYFIAIEMDKTSRYYYATIIDGEESTYVRENLSLATTIFLNLFFFFFFFLLSK